MKRNPFKIVKDSSIWYNPDNYAMFDRRDGLMRIGVVRKTANDSATGELRYLVDVQILSDTVPVSCKMLRRFGGVFNYEDYIMQGYNSNDIPDPVSFPEAKAGDLVLVCLLNGQAREGVIVGGLSHPARKTKVQVAKGPQYKSEFNGLETSINESGEMIVTFKGIPTNINALKIASTKKIPDPTYDTKIGTTFYKLDKTGGFIVSDNSTSKEGPQSIHIDKANGFVRVLSGKISLKLDKKLEQVSLTSKILSVNSTKSASIKSPKIAIGKEGVELLDQLAQLIDAIGNIQPISPVGPCTPISATPQWVQVEAVKSKIKEITGSF